LLWPGAGSDGCFSTSDTTPWSCAWIGATGSTPACGAARVLVPSISLAGARSNGSRCRVRARRSRIAPAMPKAALRRPPRAEQSKARKMASCCTSRVYRLSRCNHPCRPARGRRRRAGRASPRQSPARGAPDAVPRSGAALDSYTAGFGSESDSGLPNVPSREADGLTDRRPQPGRMARLDGDQRGQRHQLVAAAGHRHHRGAAAAAPGAALWAALSPSRIRPRRPARRPGPPPSFYHRPGLLPPRGDPLLVALGGPGPTRSSRSGAAARPSRPACTPPRTRCQTCSAIRARVQH
jgi:hypothetical protein